MISSLRTKRLLLFDDLISSKVTLLQPVPVAGDDGNVSKTSQYQAFDIAESLSPFRSMDFSIASLESVGALSKLTTTFMSHMHDMNIADKFDTYSLPVES